MPPKKSSAGGTSIAKAAGVKGTKASTGGLLIGKKPANTVTTTALTRNLEATPTPAYTKEQLALAEGRPDLEPNSSTYNALWEDVKKKMGMPKNAPSMFT